MTSDRLLFSTLQTIRKYALLAPGEQILVAVSGGLDSMVLFDLLSRLRNECSITLGAAHCNFRLRGDESDEDERFVVDHMTERAVPFHIRGFDTEDLARVRHRSLQETARDLRYGFFAELRRTHGYHRVATAHHADDNAETMLLNLIRGTGVRGLSGIPVRNERESVIRPLLFASRAELEAYAAERGITFREDSSNAKEDYTRNYVRHTLIPRIREHLNPNLSATLGRTSTLFASLDAWLGDQLRHARESVVHSRTEEMVVLRADAFLRLPEFLRAELLCTILRDATGHEPEHGAIEEMLSVSVNATGTRCSVAGRFQFLRDRDRLVLRRETPHAAFAFPIAADRSYDFAGFRFSSATVASTAFSNDPLVEYVDADRLGAGLTLRSWHAGDWFIPLGMEDRRKVSDFYIDEKIPLFEKETIPILESDGEIVWICGRRLDNRFKIRPETRRFLKLVYQPL